MKVSNGAKIRNRYNQVPHLTQDTNGKVTNSQKTPQTPFPEILDPPLSGGPFSDKLDEKGTSLYLHTQYAHQER